MKVLTYLDCGCAIMEDGHRCYCPTCEQDSLPKYPQEPFTPEYEAFMAMEEAGESIADHD